MTRRIKRHPAFELTLEVKDDAFIRTPRERQRNWLLSRAMKEMADELIVLDELARTFIPALTTIHQPRRAMGEAAMRRLLAILAGDDAPPATLILDHALIERASAAPP